MHRPGAPRVVAPSLDPGPAAEKNIGAIILANDMVSERELRAFLPNEGVNLYATRIPCDVEGSVSALEAMAGHLAEASSRLTPAERLDAVIFSCTSGTAAIGFSRIEAAIKATHRHSTAITPLTASFDALRHMAARRIAVLTPYALDVHAMMLSLYRDEGFDVIDSATFDAGREDIVRRISPDSILQSAAALELSRVDAVFISCTAFRCAEMIESLESRCGKPVITSNQASAWAALRAAGIGAAQRSRGQLFCEARP